MKIAAAGIVTFLIIAAVGVKWVVERNAQPLPTPASAPGRTGQAPAQTHANPSPRPVARASNLPGTSDELTGLALSTAMTPIESLSDAGQSKAAAALQSYLTAAKQQNVTRLEQLVGYAEMLPNETRRQYETVANDVVAELAKECATVTSVQILGREELGPIDQLIRLRVTHADGTLKDEQFLMHCGGLGWQRDISVQSELLLQRRR